MGKATLDNAILRAREQLQEAIREIQVMAGFGSVESPDHARPAVIGVTSPDHGDGKTTVAIALAASLTYDLGARVTLVDADLQTHSVGQAFGLEDCGGLTELVSGTITLADAHQRVRIPNLTVISAGTAEVEAARVAHSPQMRQILADIKQESRFVIVDLPATLHSMAAPILAQRCDGVVLVARAGHTTRRNLERVHRLLSESTVLGVIINRAQTHIPGFVARALDLRG